MAVDTTVTRWQPPAGGVDALNSQHLHKLSQAMNQIEGLHSAVIEHNLTLASQDRLLRVGPQTTPVGVIVTLQPGSVMTTL